MAEREIYSASRIFTGEKWLTDHAVVIAGNLIEEIIPLSVLPAGQKHIHFNNAFIAPAFIDLQIYGAYGRLLAAYPEADSLVKLVDYCQRGGAAWCLPTVATNTREVFFQCIDAVREYWKTGAGGVLGLHLEGPWLNPVKRGAHIESIIHSPSLDEVKEMLDYGRGVIRWITLAPEICSEQVIEYIISQDIIVAAGHSNANYEQAIKSFDHGIQAVTHLYNAMSPLQHRAPGLVGAAMDHDKVMSSIIPDGYHVDYAAVRIAKQVMKERLYAITDAVTETNTGPYQHYPAGDKYESAGILSGSALTMHKALYNLVYHVGLRPEEALKMCSRYPAKIARIDDRAGWIKPGYQASILCMDERLEKILWQQMQHT